ncbi:MAG: hypothetical protein JWN42_1103 [Candidatus Angelobacter sp.]|nr:hypothetical protein [Candidatus Angelobacter sp.]
MVGSRDYGSREPDYDRSLSAKTPRVTLAGQNCSDPPANHSRECGPERSRCVGQPLDAKEPPGCDPGRWSPHRPHHLKASFSPGDAAYAALNWVSPDDASMLAFYGENATPKDVLSGKVPHHLLQKVFLTAVRGAEEQAKKQSETIELIPPIYADFLCSASSIPCRCAAPLSMS